MPKSLTVCALHRIITILLNSGHNSPTEYSSWQNLGIDEDLGYFQWVAFFYLCGILCFYSILWAICSGFYFIIGSVFLEGCIKLFLNRYLDFDVR